MKKRRPYHKSILTVAQILAWADQHHARTGEWPGVDSGPVLGAPDESWANINGALYAGHRGLPGGSSLARLRAEYRGDHPYCGRPRLTVAQILSWADRHYVRTGDWPTLNSGQVFGTHSETWSAINQALRSGGRGLPGGSSLARLLAQRQRDRPSPYVKPRLTVAQILAWADRHHARTGEWPKLHSGRVLGAPGESWLGINTALRGGLRGLPRGSTLARLLAEHRDVHRTSYKSILTVAQILAWADRHHARTGEWPGMKSGPVLGAPDESWVNINAALYVGLRGLPGGSTLPQLLAEHRGRRNRGCLPRYTIAKILAWADAFHRRTGDWPGPESGPILDAPGETWMAVNVALNQGRRGLPGGTTLGQLLAERRGVPIGPFTPLTVKQILGWADAHHRRTGEWPHSASGPITDAPGETWRNISKALRGGRRELPGGFSLCELLAEQRGVRNRSKLPPLTERQILDWADAHHRRTGCWPIRRSGPVADAPGEIWLAVNTALVLGGRGLPGGSSLAQLLTKRRGVRNVSRPPPLTEKQILDWADAHHRRTGCWPTRESGPVVDVPGETWSAMSSALNRGGRGLPGGSSLARLLAERRGVPNNMNRPLLTIRQIQRWMKAHYRRTGRWPSQHSGPISDAPGETWKNINSLLHAGGRGLPGGLSLPRIRPGRRPGR